MSNERDGRGQGVRVGDRVRMTLGGVECEGVVDGPDPEDDEGVSVLDPENGYIYYLKRSDLTLVSRAPTPEPAPASEPVQPAPTPGRRVEAYVMWRCELICQGCGVHLYHRVGTIEAAFGSDAALKEMARIQAEALATYALHPCYAGGELKYHEHAEPPQP